MKKRIIIACFFAVTVALAGCAEAGDTDGNPGVETQEENGMEDSGGENREENTGDSQNTETQVSGTETAPEETDWYTVYYERYYAAWEDEDEMIAELNNRAVYHENCSFYGDVNQFLEGVLEITDISGLVEPLLGLDMVAMEKEDFADFPPLMIHILKNQIYAMHGYIFKDEDLDNYFRGLLWYTPQYTAEEFDDSVFNETERHNLEILAELDTY